MSHTLPAQNPDKSVEAEGFYMVGQCYSITLSPSDKYQWFGNRKRLELFQNHLSVELLHLTMKYQMYLEISEPHEARPAGSYKGPRLHLHGWMNFSSADEILQFLISGYYRLTRWCSVDIDKVNDKAVWLAYCTKQRVIPARYRLYVSISGLAMKRKFLRLSPKLVI